MSMGFFDLPAHRPRQLQPSVQRVVKFVGPVMAEILAHAAVFWAVVAKLQA